MTRPISTVVFDLDDTLIASARARQRAYRALYEVGIDPREAEAANDRWWDTYYRGECSLEQVRQNRWIDLGLSSQQAVEVDARFRTHHQNIRARRGARRMLERLREENLKLVLLSNAGIDYVRDRVADLRVAHLLDGIVDMADAPWKPHPAAFQAALRCVGGSPESAAMVGDKLDADVKGALDAGFRSVVWLTRRKPLPHPRVVTVPSLAAAELHLLSLVYPHEEDTRDGSEQQRWRTVAATGNHGEYPAEAAT